MSKKQLVLLFLGGLVPWTIGNGLMCLLPILALELGATEATTGYYLALSFLALTAGSAFTGWLSDKLNRRRLLLFISAAGLIPSLWGMGAAKNIVQLAFATSGAWFSAGMAISATTILAGLFARKDERGKVLGFIAMANGLGSIIGGLSVGPMVDRWGYPTMFMALCVFSMGLFVIGILVADKRVEGADEPVCEGVAEGMAGSGADSVTDLGTDSGSGVAQAPAAATSKKHTFGKAFYILLIAQLIVLVMHSMAAMGRSLSMNNLQFTATAISSTVVISGVVSLPFPFLIGWLSDRLGRKRTMVIAYVGYTMCMVTLALSSSLWHFWIVVILLKVGMVSLSVGAAFVTDIVEPKALGRGVAVFQAMGWFGFAIGFIVAGNVFQSFGVTVSSFFSAILPLIAIIFILVIRTTAAKKEEALAEEVPAA